VGNVVPLNLLPPTVVNLTSIAPITLGLGAEVTGSVLTTSQPTEALGAKIDGTLTVAPSLLVTDYTWNVTFPGTVSDVNVGLLQSQTLTPGAYGNVTVGATATLTLTAGVYTFNSLSLNLLGSMLVNASSGPVVLYVQNSLALPKAISIVNGGPTSFFLGYAGTSNVLLAACFSGTFVAPNAGLILGPFVHTGAFFAPSIELLPLGQIVHSPFMGWSTGVIPLQGPPPAQAPSLAALPPAQAQPPLQGASDLPAFLQWAYQSRPSQGRALMAAVQGVAGNESIGTALVTVLNNDTDLGTSLVELSILGQLKTQAGFQYLTSLLTTPIPTTGTMVGEYGSMPLEAIDLVKRQARAVDGVALMLTPAADAALLQVIGSTQSDIMVVARAVHDFLFVHGSYARATLSALLPASEQILLDQVDVNANGASFDTRLQAYLTLHPEVVPPPVTP
jgi:hypothetical protein